MKIYGLLYLTSVRELPAAKHAHPFWDDGSNCNTVPQEQAPIQPGGRRQSAELTAVPEGQTLSGEQRGVMFRTR